jgi:CheY-like chemotaxis protein
VGQLTGGIAHDFNNLLTVILGNAELLIDTPSEPARTKALSGMILQAAERGADLTQKLLAFGRRQSLKSELLNIVDAVSGMTPLLRRAIGEHIDLRTEVSGREAFALVDRTLLESAILNLVVNARDAMPQGGTITISAGRQSLSRGESKQPAGKEAVMLTVTDTGTGMPPEVMARVFEPFFTTKEVGKGSGLGLSMVYGFAQQSGGDVSIKSKEGEGTSITITLPLADRGAAKADAGEADSSMPISGSGKLLVVEDDPQVLDLVSTQLRSIGYTVTSATTASEAMRLIEQNDEYDILFTDVVLPKGMSGIELANKVRSSNPHLKVLLTSGYPEEVFQQHGRPADGVPLLRKPYKRAELAEALRTALDDKARSRLRKCA